MQSNKKYNFKEIEQKWQQVWDKECAFNFVENNILKKERKNFYVLEMLPYPSGKLHMGHVRNYTAGDVIARYKKMLGYNVLHPIGWDSFGLPAENAAIENKVKPQDWIDKNISQMKIQLKKMGFSYQWDREISTCDPDYYKHEQAIFIDLLKANLAYQKESIVNWDPVDQTVLANEQVIDGRGWRSKAIVVKKNLKQWFLRISNFSEELLNDLDILNQWPEQVKSMQSNWIGKSQGAEILFNINYEESKEINDQEKEEIKNNSNTINVFTTRPDTIFGCTFVGISINHPIAKILSKNNTAISEFIGKHNVYIDHEAEYEKEGILTNIYVDHPFNNKEIVLNGNTVQIPKLPKIPVYIANFVLSEYGSGAVFGCPGHDKRDLEFAKKYQIPVIKVVENKNKQSDEKPSKKIKESIMTQSYFLNNLAPTEAQKIILDVLEENKIGSKSIKYKLHDWGVSRQRYWGCPIPIVNCAKCGIVPEKKENLPIKLPEDIDIIGNSNPLEMHPTWKYCKCPKCGKDAQRETDTFDTFFESSWYFLRYLSPKEKDKPFIKDIAEAMLPVDEYIGGIEHAILHLMYARFFVKALTKIGYVSLKEPFKRLTTQGMVCHRAYKDQKGKWIEPTKVTKKDNKLINIETEEEVIDEGVFKMGKSTKNTIDPDQMIDLYGADSIRLFILSNTPLDKNIEWSNKSAEHSMQYLYKIWNICINNIDSIKKYATKYHEYLSESDNSNNSKLISTIHQTIKKYSEYINNFEFNKAIALLHILSNIIEEEIVEIGKKDTGNNKEIGLALITLITLISPISPHIAEEIWNLAGSKDLIATQKWPKYNQNMIKIRSISIGVQINGKIRDSITVSTNATSEECTETAMNSEKIKKAIEGREIVKIVSIPGKIVSIVVK